MQMSGYKVIPGTILSENAEIQALNANLKCFIDRLLQTELIKGGGHDPNGICHKKEI
jgi:hypothetical protein